MEKCLNIKGLLNLIKNKISHCAKHIIVDDVVYVQNFLKTNSVISMHALFIINLYKQIKVKCYLVPRKFLSF